MGRSRRGPVVNYARQAMSAATPHRGHPGFNWKHSVPGTIHHTLQKTTALVVWTHACRSMPPCTYATWTSCPNARMAHLPTVVVLTLPEHCLHQASAPCSLVPVVTVPTSSKQVISNSVHPHCPTTLTKRRAANPSLVVHRCGYLPIKAGKHTKVSPQFFQIPCQSRASR